MSSPPDAPDAPHEPGVLVEDDGGARTVRLNRPAAMNALDVATKVALRDALLAAAGDPAVRCVVLTGTRRAFCVGQDLQASTCGCSRSAPRSLWRTVPEHYNPIVTALATMPKPVVAAVNGVAAGAGAAFALAADFRIVADSAGFNLAFTGIALSGDSGSSWWLPRLVGVAKAKELLLLPRTVRRREALDLGLATEVVPDADLAGDRPASWRGSWPPGRRWPTAPIRQAVAFAAAHALERVAGPRGGAHGADRRHRRPRGRRGGVPGEGEAGLRGPLTRAPLRLPCSAAARFRRPKPSIRGVKQPEVSTVRW